MAEVVARCAAREVRTPAQYVARWTEVAVVARERGHLEGQAELSFDWPADVDAARPALEEAVCGAIAAEEGCGEEPARERTRELVGALMEGGSRPCQERLTKRRRVAGRREQMLAEKALGHGEVKDDYTGKAIPANKSDVDHVVSKNEFHYAEGGFMLDEARRKAFANDRDNLAVTDRSVNRSKGSESIPDAKERRPEIDRRRTRHTEERAGEAVSRHRPSAAQAARYYGKKVAPEAAASGLRLGMRQALGLCLHELTIGIFDEVTDICRNGLRADETSYAHAVEKRVAEIWRRVREKWRDMLSAFRDGFIAGALSEVVTLLVNLFYTTSNRVVRIIREGALSFLRALKMIFVLPDGMTRAEALDAATKAMAGAVLTVCGIALEEGIERTLGALPFAELVVPVVLGVLVGLATAVVVFCLDRLDMFGVQANRRREFLFAELDARVEEALGAAESASGGGVSVIL